VGVAAPPAQLDRPLGRHYLSTCGRGGRSADRARGAAGRIIWSAKTFDLEQQERALIQQALERFGGSRRQAAEALRISPVTLWRKIKRYKLES
jgi:DNA-binding NtrC family response regulator